MRASGEGATSGAVGAETRDKVLGVAASAGSGRSVTGQWDGDPGQWVRRWHLVTDTASVTAVVVLGTASRQQHSVSPPRPARGRIFFLGGIARREAQAEDISGLLTFPIVPAGRYTHLGGSGVPRSGAIAAT